ncbi:MAG: 2,4-dienoyl-CoA reductase-like NADH-dependent reductase (Old Yellow Enzyme family) [bacterium]|jgi:2,4-dienoyl-CoA reductase-like NADH-dependent reductase (Old Yellow Enzyme family)
MSNPETESGFKHLLSPLVIQHPNGELVLRNRVLVSAHVSGFAENNKPGKEYIDYHRQYAREGVGLQITGGTPVHESGLLSLNSDSLWNLDDGIIPGYRKLATAVHDEGGHILAQLAHSGGTVKIDKPGVVPWSASPVRSAITGHVSHEMTHPEIDEVIQAYAQAATRVRLGGLDGIEILAAFGFLPQAFLSPLSNHRKDKYGGSLENRMRFLIQVLSAVRTVLGPTQILGVRLPGDEYESDGLELADMIVVCKKLCKLGLVDYLNVIAHTNFSATGRSKHWPPTPAKHGLFVDLAAAIKSEVSVPVFAVGRIVDPEHAERIIARDQADMVGMTRAHICDPSIVTKLKNKAQQQIRPCVGANTCIANRYIGKSIRCMHNPELRTSPKPLQPALPPKNIAIIGGGPAGLEAARICAMRGHSVTLYEASTRLGGQLAYWAQSSSMTELGRIITWRESELTRLGARIELGRKILPLELTQAFADELIIATGATDVTRELSCDSAVSIITPRQLLDSSSLSVSNAIVISDGRGQAGLVCAEYLVTKGAKVEIVTEDVAVANDLDPTNRNAWYERLGRSGVILTPQTQLERVEYNKVVMRNLFSLQLSERYSVDLVVDWNGCRALDEFEGSNHEILTHRIGDCVTPRSVEMAMAEALLIAENV